MLRWADRQKFCVRTIAPAGCSMASSAPLLIDDRNIGTFAVPRHAHADGSVGGRAAQVSRDERALAGGQAHAGHCNSRSNACRIVNDGRDVRRVSPCSHVIQRWCQPTTLTAQLMTPETTEVLEKKCACFLAREWRERC